MQSSKEGDKSYDSKRNESPLYSSNKVNISLTQSQKQAKSLKSSKAHYSGATEKTIEHQQIGGT